MRFVILLGSAVCVLLCITSAVTAKLFVAYGTYVLFEGTMYGMIALAAAQIARRYGSASQPGAPARPSRPRPRPVSALTPAPSRSR